MQKSDYLAFFSHELTSPVSEIFFGLSHFFNRVKVLAGWQNYNQVQRNERGGRVLLGQLPVDAFNAELMTELLPAGLIVSCADCYELAGCCTTSAVTAPSLWIQAGIQHHHLPFTDFSANANPELLLKTLDKMWSVYNSGGTVYVHCKAGRSRSALVVALFLFLVELKSTNLEITESVDLEEILREKIESLREIRPQVTLNEIQINLGVTILKRMAAQDEEDVAEQSEVFTQSCRFFAKLTQSPEFKALWHYAYKNTEYFAAMQYFMDALYEDPLKVSEVLHAPPKNPLTPLERACQTIAESDTGAALLDRLKVFLHNNRDRDYQSQPSPLFLAYQKFNGALIFYKNDPELLKAARELQSAIFLSTAPDEDKERWLLRTVAFLDDPTKWAKEYYDDAEIAVLSDNPGIRRVGKVMIIVGASVLMSAFFLGIVASSVFTLPVVSSIAVASLAFTLLGKMVMNSAVDERVGLYSRALIKEVESLPGIESMVF